jgi:hypothetical protein
MQAVTDAASEAGALVHDLRGGREDKRREQSKKLLLLIERNGEGR